MLKQKIRSFFYNTVSNCLNDFFKKAEEKQDYVYLFKHYVNHGIPKSYGFDYKQFRTEVLHYKEQMNIASYKYKFSKSAAESSLYNTVYAILIDILFGVDLNDQKEAIVGYLNSFQDENGFFYDESLKFCQYKDCDWFGIKHLLSHILPCYAYLNSKPKYKLSFLSQYYNDEYLQNYLESLNFDIPNDDDNKVCNLAIALQYQRDFFQDEDANNTLQKIYTFLENKLNPISGSWGNVTLSDKNEYSRVQQISYHLFLIWLYDNRPIPNIEKVIDLCLNNQTELGSYNAGLIGSACTDIDCIFLLNKLSKLTDYKREDILLSLKKAFPWVMTNQNLDGGFVFKRNEDFIYGQQELSSKKNYSNMFGTWFRALSISYICDTLNIENAFNHVDCPGLQF